MDICKITEVTRDTAICLWGFLHLSMNGLGEIFPPLITLENSPIILTVLVNLKFLALLVMLFLLNWRGIYLIRLNGFRYQHNLELFIGTCLAIYLVGLPYYVEYLFKISDDEFVDAMNMAKTSSLILLIAVLFSYIAAFLWTKKNSA